MYLYTKKKNIKKSLQSFTAHANKYKNGERGGHAYIITQKLNKNIYVNALNGAKPYGVHIFNMYSSD